MSLPHSIHVVTHPLVQHKLTKLRDKATSSTNFQELGTASCCSVHAGWSGRAKSRH